MCFQDEEPVQDLFSECRFTKEVREYVHNDVGMLSNSSFKYK
jgi:hypothetical protein